MISFIIYELFQIGIYGIKLSYSLIQSIYKWYYTKYDINQQQYNNLPYEIREKIKEEIRNELILELQSKKI